MRLYTMDAWVSDPAVLTDEPTLRAALYAGARAGGAVVLGEEFCIFPNGAVTGVLVLAQSHLSIHTWPELRARERRPALVRRRERERRARRDSRASGSRACRRDLRPPRRCLSPRPTRLDVAEAVGLAEGARGIESVLAALARLEPVSVRSLGRAADLPVPIVAAICGELRRHGVVSETRPVQFTVEGRRRFASAAAIVETSCPGCGGRGIALRGDRSPGCAAALRRLRRRRPNRSSSSTSATARRRPSSGACWPCTPRTPINGRRILLLGDDDLMSVALLRFARQFGIAIEELAVVDLDDRLLEFIETELDDAPFPFRCIRRDVREPLPPALAVGLRHRRHRPAVHVGRSAPLPRAGDRGSRRARIERLLLVRLAAARCAVRGAAGDRRGGARDPLADARLQRLRRRRRPRRDEPPLPPRRPRPSWNPATPGSTQALEEELAPRRPPVIRPRHDLPRLGDLDAGAMAVLLDVVRRVEVDRDLRGPAWLVRRDGFAGRRATASRRPRSARAPWEPGTGAR